MMQQVFHIEKKSEYEKAGATDLIRLIPVLGANPIYVVKSILEILVISICSGEKIHLSGPTGSAKSSLINALYMEPKNFKAICCALGIPCRPLKVYPIEMATFDSPGELYQRRAIRDGTTYDEDSVLVSILKAIAQSNEDAYHLVHLREIGRVHSASIQGGLLDLMVDGSIVLPDSSHLDIPGLAWIADSNYQAEADGTYVLATFDDALKRRFTVNLTLGYLSKEQETIVLLHLAGEYQMNIEDQVVRDIVKLGHKIRERRSQGELQSVPSPTIYGYLALLRLYANLSHLSLIDLFNCTLLGNASPADTGAAKALVSDCLGIQLEQELDTVIGGVGI
jgi:hypothetical protein